MFAPFGRTLRTESFAASRYIGTPVTRPDSPIAFERTGCECVFSSDWNEQAQVTYEANLGGKPHGDIHTVAIADIPPRDILWNWACS